MAASHEVKTLARKLAGECLNDAGYEAEASKSVRLVPLRKILLVKNVRRVKDLSAREGAVMPLDSQLSLWNADEAKVIVGGEGITLRFTYAHELAHWAARLRLPEEVPSKWSPDEVRQFCDEFAGRLLVPNELLIRTLYAASIDVERPFEISIPLIENVYRRIQAPMATVLKRIADAVEEGRLHISNCAMLVCPGRSAKRRSDYAARILTCCTPLKWFVPANKRLTTLGMLNLDRKFWEASPLQVGYVVDQFAVWLRDGWDRHSVQRQIRYKLYATDKVRHSSRAMLGVFSGPAGE